MKIQFTMNQDNTLVIKFSQIEIPTFTTPKANGKGFIKFGKDNLWPQFLIELAKHSSLHNAILQSEVLYTYGAGLQPDSNSVATLMWLNHPNPYETVNDIYKKCILDYCMFGGFALNIIWSTDEKSISQVYHVDFSKLRCGEPDERGFVENFYFANDWTKSSEKGKLIKAYDPSKKKGSQIYYFKEYQPSSPVYPLPTYVGSLDWIAIDKEISNFHLSHLINGMSPNWAINFANGIPTEEERRKIKQQIEDNYCGSDNSGKFILTFCDNAEQLPTFQNLSADNLDEQFLQLQNSVLQEILSGHRVVSPLLVGIKTEGQLGGATELETAYAIYRATVIKPMQSRIVKVFNELLPYTPGYDGEELSATEYKLDLNTENDGEQNLFD